jgi:hypothetical protein
MKEETTNNRLRAINVGTLTTRGTFILTDRKSRMMMVQLDHLAPYQVVALDEEVGVEQLERSTLHTDPQERKVRPITDITSTALRKEEMAVRLWAVRNEHP